MDASSSQGPSAATLSRARYKLDILNMYCRRWEWGQDDAFRKKILTLCYLAEGLLHAMTNLQPLTYVSKVMTRQHKPKNYSSWRNSRPGSSAAMLLICSCLDLMLCCVMLCYVMLFCVFMLLVTSSGLFNVSCMCLLA